MSISKSETRPIAWNPSILRSSIFENLSRHSQIAHSAIEKYVNKKTYPREVVVKDTLLKKMHKHFLKNAYLFLYRYIDTGKPDGLITRKGERCFLDINPQKILLLHSVFQQMDFPWRGVWVHRLFYLKKFLELDKEVEKKFWDTLLKIYREEPICEFEKVALDAFEDYIKEHGVVVSPVMVLNSYYKSLVGRSLLSDQHKTIFPNNTPQAVRETFHRVSLTARWTTLSELLALLTASRKLAIWFFNYSYEFVRKLILDTYGYEPVVIIE